MAHGGHAGGHAHTHVHHYSRTRSSYSSTSPFETVIALIFIAVFLGIFIYIGLNEEPLGGKEPITGTYELYRDYVIDENGYLTNHENIISGLEYLHDATNIQMVVLVSDESWSDGKAVEKYYELFNDEGHVLLIVPRSWLSSTKYYAIGDDADVAISDRQISYLIKKLGNSTDGEKWQKVLTDFADLLISD